MRDFIQRASSHAPPQTSWHIMAVELHASKITPWPERSAIASDASSVSSTSSDLRNRTSADASPGDDVDADCTSWHEHLSPA